MADEQVVLQDSIPAPQAGSTLDSFDFDNDPNAIRNFFDLPEEEGRALLENANPEQQAAMLRAAQKASSIPLAEPNAQGSGSSGIERIMEAVAPEVPELMKGSAVPVAYGVGSMVGRRTGIPMAGKVVGSLAAGATDIAINKIGPAVENWYHENIANPFGLDEQKPAGPLGAEDVVQAAIETPLNLIGMTGARSVGKVGYEAKQSAVSRVRKFISAYSSEMVGDVDKTSGRITSSIDNAIQTALDMGILKRTEKQRFFAGDEKTLGRIQLALGGDDIREGAIPMLGDKLHSLINESGRAVSQSDVMTTLAKVKGELSKYIVSDEFLDKHAGLTSEARDAAYAGMKVLDDKIAQLLDPAGAASEPMFMDRPLEWLHTWKRSLQKETNYNLATMDNNREIKNTVLMKAAGLVKDEVERLVDRTFAGTGREGAIKKVNSTLGDLIDLRSVTDAAISRFAKSGVSKSRLPRLPQMAASMGAVAGGLWSMGQPELASGSLALVPPIYGAIQFVGNASNQMRIAHLQNLSGRVLESISKVVGQTGGFNVYPRNIKELALNSANIKRQLSLAAVDPEVVNAVDGILSMGNPESKARALSDFIINSPAGEFVDSMLHTIDRGYKSLFEVDGQTRLFDNAEVIDFSNYLDSQMTPENELEITKKRRALHKNGAVDVGDLTKTILEESSEAPSVATEATPEDKPSALSTLAGTMRQTYDY